MNCKKCGSDVFHKIIGNQGEVITVCVMCGTVREDGFEYRNQGTSSYKDDDILQEFAVDRHVYVRGRGARV